MSALSAPSLRGSITALGGLIAGVALTVTLAANADGSSDPRRTFPYGGYVDFDGAPVNASGVRFNFALFACPTPGPAASQCPALWVAKGAWNAAASDWTQGWPTGNGNTLPLPVFAGRFSVELGADGQNALPDAVFASGYDNLYLAISLEGRALGSLQKITPALRAIVSDEADRLRVRGDVSFDDPTSGGSAALQGDDGLRISASRAGMTAADPILRVGSDASPTLVVSGAGAVVNGRLDVNGSIGAIGTSPGHSGASCKAILGEEPGSVDGVYWISPDGGAPLAVQCDMTHGGLTFAAFERAAKRPVAWWDMETTTGGLVKDLVGSNNLQLVGSPVPGQPGQIGLSYKLTSANDYFISEDAFPSQLVGRTPKTIAAWFQLTTIVGDHMPVLSIGGSGVPYGSLAIDVSPVGDGGKLFAITHSADVDSLANIMTGSWHHVVITYDKLLVRTYLDGAPTGWGARAELSLANNFDKVTLGTDSWWATTKHRMANGFIDDAKIYDYALSLDEVQQLYTLGQRLGGD